VKAKQIANVLKMKTFLFLWLSLITLLVIFLAFFVLRVRLFPTVAVNEAPLTASLLNDESFNELSLSIPPMIEPPSAQAPSSEMPVREPPTMLQVEATLAMMRLSFAEGSAFLPILYRLPVELAVEAYYAGEIEAAIQLLSAPGAGLDQKRQLVILYWELGENARAANLLEDLLREPHLTMALRDELQMSLFFTRVLSANYADAAAMRGTLQPVLQRMNNRLRAEFYFYNALVYHEMGDLTNAEEYYRRSLDIYSWRAIAWYRLGTILLNRANGDEEILEEAEAAFMASWDQDRALTPAMLPVARFLAERGQWIQARNLLITANERRPDDPEISASLADALRRIGPPGDGSYFIRRQITVIPPRVTPAPITPGEGIMRIGLNENRHLLSVKAGGDFTIYNAETREVLYNGTARTQFWVEWDRQYSLFLRDANNRIMLTSSVPVVLELHSNEDTSIVAGVVTGAPGLNRTYRGHLEFRPGPTGITAVSIVTMGDYLYGVVPAEIPPRWPREVLYVQAIISRSYAIAQRGMFAYRGFDIWNTARSQTYMGVGIEDYRSNSAVDATRGIVLVGESNEPLMAFYSANHGGHSEDAMVMWGFEAYMQAVQDPLLPPRNAPLPPDALFRWIQLSPATYSNAPGYFFPNTYRWERWVSPEEIRRRLIEDTRVGQDPGEIHRIITRGRGISGRIVELEVQGSEGNVRVRGNPIWFTMGGLRSSLFTIRTKMAADGSVQHFVFQGAGYGHGIGLDQHAAAAKAGAGMSAGEILHHFYPRATVRMLDPYVSEENPLAAM